MLGEEKKQMGRIIVVGDEHQCQPAGTMVEVTGGSRKPIELVEAGDKLVSYDRHSACFVGRISQGRSVLKKASRPYSGKLYTISAGNYETNCTDSHKWITRFKDRNTRINVVYLMRQKNRWRVGWCQLFTKAGQTHLSYRARIEDADCAWILTTHDSRTDASVYESIVATKFGLPMMPFKEVNGANHMTQSAIDSFFCALDAKEQEERAIKCLYHHERRVEFPFYIRRDQERQGRSTIFMTQACNLIPDLMLLPVYNGVKEVEWFPCGVSCEDWEGTVYSLDVETHHNYIADGIVTHNSIYGFRGADISAFQSFQEILESRPNGCKSFPLSVCRRCPRSHIRLAQAIVPDIQWMTTENSGIEAPEGEIYQVSSNVALDMMREGDMGIGRVNKVLIPAAYTLIRMRKKVIIRGRDIGTGLISLIKKMKATSITDLLTKMGNWFTKEVGKLCAKEGVEDPTQLQKGATKYQSLEDRVQCIEALCDGIDTLDELIVTIEKLFADFDDSGKPKQAIVLGTVHRTKGLEAFNVTILDPENFPHKLAKKSWERTQEMNLAYVASTRAKFSLAKDGSVIEPGRLVFVGACPRIYRAQWLMGSVKHPNDGKPFPTQPVVEQKPQRELTPEEIEEQRHEAMMRAIEEANF
jgi:hypothetical protein